MRCQPGSQGKFQRPPHNHSSSAVDAPSLPHLNHHTHLPPNLSTPTPNTTTPTAITASNQNTPPLTTLPKPIFTSSLQRRRDDMISQSMPSSRPTFGSSRSYTAAQSFDSDSFFLPTPNVASHPLSTTTTSQATAVKRAAPDSDHCPSSDGRGTTTRPSKIIFLEFRADHCCAIASRPATKMARTMSFSAVEELKAPDNFALVAGNVYRSSFPKPENFAYLKRLGLKTVL